MQTLKFTLEDKRGMFEKAEGFQIGEAQVGDKNWVQGRQYESSLRQVKVIVYQDKEMTQPFDLTGINPMFEGLTGDERKIIDGRHSVMLDAPNGVFRFDFPAQAFATFGSYKQAFFRLYRDGLSVATLEFPFEVLADQVISGIIPSDYMDPLQELIDEMNASKDKAASDINKIISDWNNKYSQLFKDLSNQGDDTSNTLLQLQATLKDLEAQIKLDGLITINEFDGKFNAAYKTVTDTLKTVSGYVDTVKNSSWFYNNIKPLSAHRGAHIDAPENTVMAVAHAGMYGYGLIECDPRLTSDNQVVLMHDDTVDRMTDGAGNVSDFTLDQLKQMKVDAEFAGKNDYNTIRIPTLSEILSEINQYGMGVNIDGGKLNWQDDNVINTVVGVIKQAGLMGRTIFTVSDLASRKRLNTLYPEAALSWTDYDNIDDCIAEAKTYINAVPTVVYGDLSRNYRAVVASGLPLHVWGVNSTSQYYDSIQHGARFVETDTLLPMTVTTA